MYIGDSVAKGVVLDDARGRYIFAKESAARLFAQDGGMEVDNLASFGCTVTKGEEMLQKCGPRIGDYDYTVLEFGGNDCDFDWKSVSDDPEASHICKTPLETFKQKYARMLETIKRFGGKPVVLNLPPIDSGRYFRWISRNLSPSRILRFLKEVGFIAAGRRCSTSRRYRWRRPPACRSSTSAAHFSRSRISAAISARTASTPTKPDKS